MGDREVIREIARSASCRILITWGFCLKSNFSQVKLPSYHRFLVDASASHTKITFIIKIWLTELR